MKEITLKELRKFNMVMGGLHLIQGLIMLFLATSVIQNIAEFKPNITQFYLAFNPQTQSLESASKILFELPFGIMVASFLLLSAVAHALISIPKRLNDKYNSDLEIGINQFRWFEYALSSSIMIVLIAILLYMFGNGNFDRVPWFVWAIVGTYFVAFNTFPVNMVFQYKKIGKWKDYIYGERVYITLSLVAKSILAWLVLFGAMQP